MSRYATLRAAPLVPLGDVVVSRAGKTPSSTNPDYWDGNIPWVSAKDLKTLHLRGSRDRITEAAVRDGAPIAEPGSVLILVRGMTLLKDVPVGLATVPMSFNQDLRCLRPKHGVLGPYLAYFLTAARSHLLSLVTQAGHGTGRIDGDLLLETPVRLPPLYAQQWIARQLATADRAIVTMDEVIAAKRELKRGLMQELLTAKRRFRGFHGEWTPCRLGELFDERNESNRGDLRLLSVTADRGVIPREWVERKDTSNADKTAYKRVSPGDIAYNTMRMWQGVSALSDYEGIVSPAYTVLVPRETISGRFARHLFKLPKMVHTFWRNSQGLVDDTLSLKYPALARIQATIPDDLAEQERIADVLDMFDREISILEAQRDRLEDQKHALMQKLLSGELDISADPGTPEPVDA